MLGWLRRRAAENGGTASRDAGEATGGAATRSSEPDHVATTARTVRGLRFRYFGLTAAFVALCGGLVYAGHVVNTRFSNATAMAVLVAEATEVTDRIARTALEMGSGSGADWTEKALRVHAERLDGVLGRMETLWQRLEAPFAAQLTVSTPYGERQPMELLAEFRNEVATAAEIEPEKREKTGRYLDGMIGFQVAPALAQQAGILRNFHRTMAENAKIAFNVVGGVFALFAAGMFFGIFLPLDRSIRTALAKLRGALEAAKTSERAKSEFLANMSHEIRTPMNGVLGMAELMAGTELDARQRTFNDVIVKSGNALLTIINDILDFSKIDAGHIELDPAPFNLREAV